MVAVLPYGERKGIVINGMDLSNHIAITSHQDITAICQPLFDITAVTYFDFFREYDDKSRIWLSSDPLWTNYLYNKDYVNITEFVETEDVFIPSGCYTWSSLVERCNSRYERQLYTEKLTDAYNHFSVRNGIAFIENGIGYREFFNFGTRHKAINIIDNYLTNRSLFERFLFYFKQEAATLISKADKQRIIYPINNAVKPNSNLIFPEQYNKQEFKINKYFLSGKHRNIYLTKQQFKCAVLLLQGHRIKSIAYIMDISARTVEEYINKVKDKLQCHTVEEMKMELRKSVPCFNWNQMIAN